VYRLNTQINNQNQYKQNAKRKGTLVPTARFYLAFDPEAALQSVFP
jgi:hypothetical protein